MKKLENDLNLVSLIEEYTYYFIKKQYKSYCREKSIKYIEKKQITSVVENLLENKFYDCKIFTVEKLNEEYDLTHDNKIEIEDIFTDIKEDNKNVVFKISEIIDEFQIKREFYN